MKSLKAFVIDDQDEILDFFKSYEDINETVHFTYAQTCEKAFEIMNKNDFSIVISDINLPDGNGLEILESFYKNHPSVKRVAMSGYEKYFILDMLSDKSIFEYYLEKPLYLEKVNKLLTAIFDFKKYSFFSGIYPPYPPKQLF